MMVLKTLFFIKLSKITSIISVINASSLPFSKKTQTVLILRSYTIFTIYYKIL
jgi:hypothetical protein